MDYIKKPIGYAIWLLAFGLSIKLAWDFSGQQLSVAFGALFLALVMSAFGLIFARDAWRLKAWPEFCFGSALWIAGAASFGIMEFGFWSSSYNERHAVYVQAKTTQARAEGLDERDWKALTTGQLPVAPAQIEAQLNAARQNERWRATSGCTDATTRPSQEFCKTFFEMQASLAGAQQRIRLEEKFKAMPSPQGRDMVHDVFAQAETLSHWLNIDEKQAASLVIITTWLLLMLARDTGLLVANPLGRQRKPQEAPKAVPAAATRADAETPHVSRSVPVLDAHPHDLKRLGELGRMMKEAIAEREPGSSGGDMTDPSGGGGGHVAAPEEKPEAETPVSNVYALKPPATASAPTAWKITKAERREQRDKRKQVNKLHLSHATVRDWIKACNVRVDETVARSFSDVRSAYEEWCGAEIKQRPNALARIIRDEFKLPPSKGKNNRNSAGSHYPLVWDVPMAEPKRRVA